MKKIMMIIMAIALVATLAACGPATAPAENGPQESGTSLTRMLAGASVEYAPGMDVQDEDYSEYEPFGLSFDEKSRRLYYEGNLVRVFEDLTQLEDGNTFGRQYYCGEGTVDVFSEREAPDKSANPYDPKGPILALKTLSQDEFSARDLTEFTNPPPSEAHSGEPMTPEEMRAQYADYVPWGITLSDDATRMYYEGKSVADFMDLLSSNGETLSSGKFEGTIRSTTFDKGGEINLTIVRDYSQPDSSGFGTIIGVEVELA